MKPKQKKENTKYKPLLWSIRDVNAKRGDTLSMMKSLRELGTIRINARGII